ncbi:MAG: hypothetical protein M0R74_18715 [Dehalococcoidia bacterium]|nr:hypothetical protein [Dehalococcoidia bacterium]
MTTVADFEEYTDVHGVITIGGVVLANVQYDVKWKRNVVSVPRAGAKSNREIPGILSVETKLKKVLIHDDAPIVLGYSLNDTPITGGAEALLVASGVLDGTTRVTDLTTTTLAAASRIQLTLQTKDVTVGGTATLVGEDANGNPIAEVLVVPADMEIGDTLTTAKVFAKAFTLTTIGVDSADDTGTFKVDAIAGSSTLTVGDPKVFDLVGMVTKGGKSIQITQPDCWFANGGLTWTEGGSPIDVELEVRMYDPSLLEVDIVG